MKPPCHENELVRINRIIGQLEGVKRMIENQRYCPDILMQLKAARSAICSAERKIIGKHLESCVYAATLESTPEKKQAMIQELVKLYSIS